MQVSLVIVTDGRPDSVLRTLESLDWIEGSVFEVIAVCGPTPDGTRDRVAGWAGRIKIVYCSVRNISTARNLGVAAAAGDIVAFLDDDAIPEADWLGGLIAAFSDPDVGAA